MGIALGIGSAMLKIRARPWNRQGDEGGAAAVPPPAGPAPKVSIDQTEYRFGTLGKQAAGTHDFVFRNTGSAPLVLTAGATSTLHVQSLIKGDNIPPGGSAIVTLTWTLKDKGGPYQERAKILTNDPARPEVTLTVMGEFTMALRLSPPVVTFNQLSIGERGTVQSQLFCYLNEPLKILSHRWSDPSTARYFDVTLRPLSEKEVNEEPVARSGVLIEVTVKPGLQQGMIHQDLVLETNVASMRHLGLTIGGTIGTHEITVAGPGWDSDTGILTLGRVPRHEGLRQRLTLIVRGPLAKQVEFKPEHVEPSDLKVTVASRGHIGQENAVSTPLIIDIPPGSAPANHVGSDQGKLGEIILTTTHPKVPKLRILVRFVIEG